jgi:hydrogenase-4 component B
VVLFLAALALLLAGGCSAPALRRAPRWAMAIGAGSAITACAMGLLAAVRVLLGAPSVSLHLAWSVPYGAFSVAIDPLSAFFLVPAFALPALAAVYGAEYMEPADAASWFFFNLLVASMALVLAARNAVLFLVGWEAMALASFFLVTWEDDDADARDAGWTYMVASHLGTAWLLALFVLLGHGAGALDFDRFTPAAGAGLLFVMALVGFGTKAGLMPLHVWLPEAHPAAPSHVSALMSGVMITTGIYGLLRTLTFIEPLPGWAGWLLVAVGSTSAVVGVLLALAQHDLKRLLAYSTVENAGIIALAIGLALVGLHAGSSSLTVLGLAGALFHVLNHAFAKGLLFLAAGAVAQSARSRRMDTLGGLLTRMPSTGLAFAVAAVAVSGLPPLNGFASEVVVYLGALRAATSTATASAVAGFITIATLALVGGVAAACFAKAFGVTFLGLPRSDRAADATEPGPCMRTPMRLLAVACVGLAAAAPLVVVRLAPVVVQLAALPIDAVRTELAAASRTLAPLSACAVAMLAVALVATAVRARLLARRSVTVGPTWDCGYATSSARLQYTGSSFVQPLADLFTPLTGTRRHLAPAVGFFPQAASFASETPDPCRERVYRPVFTGLERTLAPLRWLQHGRVQLYVLYIAFTLIVLLVWKLGEP